MSRVVADANIYISAVMFGGLPGSVLDLGLLRAFTCRQPRHESS